jgi:hypothetical protein
MARTKLQQNDMYKRNPDVSMGLMMALSSVNFENALSNQYSEYSKSQNLLAAPLADGRKRKGFRKAGRKPFHIGRVILVKFQSLVDECFHGLRGLKRSFGLIFLGAHARISHLNGILVNQFQI